MESVLEEAALPAGICSALLEHSTGCFRDIMKAAPPPRPSALKLPMPGGPASPDVASAAAQLLTAHSLTIPPVSSQSGSPTQPDSAQPEPHQLSSFQQDGDRPPEMGTNPELLEDTSLGNLRSVHPHPSQPDPSQPGGPPLTDLKPVTGHAVEAVPSKGAQSAHPANSSEGHYEQLRTATGNWLASSGLLWQVFKYVEGAGLTLTPHAMEQLFYSQSVPGGVPPMLSNLTGAADDMPCSDTA